MKKIIALILCLVLVAACFAACADEATETTAAPASQTVTENTLSTETSAESSSEPAPEQPTEHEHTHISFNGLQTATFNAEDMAKAMGREPDFVSEQSTATLHVYNNVTVDGMSFSQVQFTFNEGFNRISCTVTVDTDMTEVLGLYRASMTEIYGEPTAQDTEPPIYTWHDGHTSNYAMLTAINDTTAQLAFYLYATE